MNIQQAKEHFKLAYMVKDVAPMYNHGEVILYHETMKDHMTQITAKSNKGLIVLVDKLDNEVSEITKFKSGRLACGERALDLIKIICDSAVDNEAMMKNIVGEAILIEATKINELCQ